VTRFKRKLLVFQQAEFAVKEAKLERERQPRGTCCFDLFLDADK
jgi:predicted adenine nucleotide alpha hydrolase (AANH) superfamily ATPase